MRIEFLRLDIYDMLASKHGSTFKRPDALFSPNFLFGIERPSEDLMIRLP